MPGVPRALAPPLSAAPAPVPPLPMSPPTAVRGQEAVQVDDFAAAALYTPGPAFDHDSWLHQIAEDAGMTIQAPRELPGRHFQRHQATATAFRSTMDQHMPRHRCAVCACLNPKADTLACNLTAARSSRSAIPNMELLRADYPKSPDAPRDAHTTAIVQRMGKPTSHAYCLWVDSETTVQPEGVQPHDTWVNVCKECHGALKGTSARSPCAPPCSLVRIDPGINDLPPLTPLEAVIVAPLRTNKHIIVLRPAFPNQPEDQRQKAMRGHVIAFPSVHPNAIASAFPLNPDDICEHVGVVMLSNVTCRAEVERRVRDAKVR
jgi:hypothetical protein